MIARLFINIIIFLIVMMKSSNDNTTENNEDNNNNNKDDNIIDITTRQDLESLIEKYNSFIIEVYSPECPHCVSFIPHYKKLSIIFKDTLLFAKLNSLEYPSIYEGILKVSSLPSILLYANGLFYKYNGIKEADYIYEWLENKNAFNCEEITSLTALTNLINDNVINDHGYKEPFILGVFDKNNNDDDNNNIKNFFIHLTEINRQYVSQCKYYLFDFNNKIDRSSTFLLRHNFIYSYHFQKGINTFALLDQINWDKEIVEAKIKIGREYERFLINNWLGLIEDYDNYKMNDLYHWKGTFIIFSYMTLKEREEYEVLAKKYITSNYYDSNVLIVFINLTEKYNVKQYQFFKEKGIYFSNHKFKQIKLIQMTNDLVIPFETMLKSIENKPKKAKDELIRFIEAKIINNTTAENMKLLNNTISTLGQTDNNKQNSIMNNNKESQEKNSSDSNKFLQDKTPDRRQKGLKLQNEQHKTQFNTQIILLPFYLLIYSAIFFCIYRKYTIYTPSRVDQIKSI